MLVFGKNSFSSTGGESREFPLTGELFCAYGMEVLLQVPACPSLLWESFPGRPVGIHPPLPDSTKDNPYFLSTKAPQLS